MLKLSHNEVIQSIDVNVTTTTSAMVVLVLCCCYYEVLSIFLNSIN